MVAISSVATESFEAAQGLVPNRGDEHHAAAGEEKELLNDDAVLWPWVDFFPHTSMIKQDIDFPIPSTF